MSKDEYDRWANADADEIAQELVSCASACAKPAKVVLVRAAELLDARRMTKRAVSCRIAKSGKEVIEMACKGSKKKGCGKGGKCGK